MYALTNHKQLRDSSPLTLYAIVFLNGPVSVSSTVQVPTLFHKAILKCAKLQILNYSYLRINSISKINQDDLCEIR